MALKAGLNRGYDGDVERGERNITLANILKIAAALEIRRRRFSLAPSSCSANTADRLRAEGHSYGRYRVLRKAAQTTGMKYGLGLLSGGDRRVV